MVQPASPNSDWFKTEVHIQYPAVYVFLNFTSKLYETWAIQNRGVSTFLKDFVIAEVGKRGQKSRQMVFFRLFYCCCSADGPRVPASYLPVTMTVVKKEVWIWIKVNKWKKTVEVRDNHWHRLPGDLGVGDNQKPSRHSPGQSAPGGPG